MEKSKEEMKILHYSLGFPPYRSGGLTKFCIDLMQEQRRQGDEVALLWPGSIQLFKENVSIKKNIGYGGLTSYEIINPLPVPYDEGIIDIGALTKKCKGDAYRQLLAEYQPDVIHFHTLMGLHMEFVEEAKKMGVKMIFTTHDYFPMCPKVKAFRNGKSCDCLELCEYCENCNATALSIWKLVILQSKIYRDIKESRLVKKFREKNRRKFFEDNQQRVIDCDGKPKSNTKYIELKSYYTEMLKQMNVIHANSSIAAKKYRMYYGFDTIKVIPISHGDIRDNRKIRIYDEQILRITYMGPASIEKGFQILIDAMDDLAKEDSGRQYQLNLYGAAYIDRTYAKNYGRFTPADLPQIFDNTDIVIVPSLYDETFGFNVIEALSYGVPVVVSSNVGAKELLTEDIGIIIDEIDSNKIKDILIGLSVGELEKFNKNILAMDSIKSIADMAEDLKSIL